MKPSLAIAYGMKKKAERENMASGGMCQHGKRACPMCHGGRMAEGGEIEDAVSKSLKGVFGPGDAMAKTTGDTTMPDKKPPTSPLPGQEDAVSRSLKKVFGPSDYAEGGFVEEEEKSGYEHMPMDEEKENSMAMAEDDRDLNEHGEYEVGARGTEDDNEHERKMHFDHAEENQDFDENDLVERIIKQLSEHYSEGGRVANKTDTYADFEDNQFDDLPKDDTLESHYTGKNSGDELGNAQEDEDQRDIVERIMRSRMKKDRLPHPM